MASRAARWTFAALAAVAVLTSCATPLTGRQAITWDAYKACEGTPSETRLLRITPEGGWVTQSTVPSMAPALRVNECMRGFWKSASASGRVPPLPASVTITAAPLKEGALAAAEAPAWAQGDEWSFSWEGPRGRGTFTWRVEREGAIDGVPHYVIKTGTREIFYRKDDLALSRETVNGVLVMRNTPSQLRYVWPLAAGARWEQTFRTERPVDRQSYDRVDRLTVEGEENVTVPAGVFRTLKIVHRARATNAVYYEQWYAPYVRMFVRDRDRGEDGIRTRDMTSFRLATPGRVANER